MFFEKDLQELQPINSYYGYSTKNDYFLSRKREYFRHVASNCSYVYCWNIYLVAGGDKF